MKLYRKRDDSDVICFMDEISGEIFFSNQRKKVYYYVKTGNNIYCWKKYITNKYVQINKTAYRQAQKGHRDHEGDGEDDPRPEKKEHAFGSDD